MLRVGSVQSMNGGSEWLRLGEARNATRKPYRVQARDVHSVLVHPSRRFRDLLMGSWFVRRVLEAEQPFDVGGVQAFARKRARKFKR